MRRECDPSSKHRGAIGCTICADRTVSQCNHEAGVFSTGSRSVHRWSAGRQQPVRLPPDLMGGVLVDPQGVRAAADVDPQGAPGERRLEDPLTEVAGEEQGVRAPGAEGGKKAQLGHADVLRLVHHAELERRMCHLRDLALQATEQARFGQEPALVESGGHLGEDRPEELPLPFGQASPPTEPRLVPLLFQARKLPGVDHAAPLGPQEAQAEPECGPSGKTATGSTTSAKPSCSVTTCEPC